jgi:chromate transporter
VLWPTGFSGSFDIVAASIALAALIGLFYFELKVMYVLAASALIGLLCFSFL